MNGFNMTATKLVMKLVEVKIFVQVCLFLVPQVILTKKLICVETCIDSSTSLVKKQVKVKLFVQVCLFLFVQV